MFLGDMSMAASTGTIRNVVDGGFCVGCGACAVSVPNVISINKDIYGRYSADLRNATSEELSRASSVCPFASEVKNETVLSEEIFGDKKFSMDERIGYHDGIYACRVTDKSVIERSSSGGMTTWLLEKLLLEGDIDGVIHVGESSGENSGLFDYTISEKISDLRSRGKSRYYSTTLSNVVQRVRGNGKKYAIVGVPCFIKAARLLCSNHADLSSQLVYFFALICGHMKSPGFAELLAWQMAIKPQNLMKFDFRVKNQNRSALEYDVTAWNDKNENHTTRSGALYGSNWGHTFFQLKACDFCDDIVGELGDVTLGDAWLPKYVPDWRGTNIVICRNERIKSLFLEGAKRGEVEFDHMNIDQVSFSQAGNYRHRWVGLSYRLKWAKKAGEWTPVKRIKPGSFKVNYFRRKLIRIRQDITSESHRAFLEAKNRDDLEYFLSTMKPKTDAMGRYYRAALLYNKLSNMIKPRYALDALGGKVTKLLRSLVR
jgi:coenzyme F420-reducing hydrogenase beta subunit